VGIPRCGCTQNSARRRWSSSFSAPFHPNLGPIHRFSADAGPARHIKHRSAPKPPQDKPEIKLEILDHANHTPFIRPILLDAHLYSLSEHREVRLNWLSSFCNAVPIFTLRRPWGLSKMDTVISTVQYHQKTLQQGSE